MKILIKFQVFICLIIACSTAKSQTLTEKDFKLLIDGKYINGTAITIEELLKMKSITTNFTWLSFERIVIIIDFRTIDEIDHVYDGTMTISCEGGTISEYAKSWFKKLRPTSRVFFLAYGAKNKSGKEITIPDIYLRIK
ncbi:MAG: hypothetical protein ABIR78_04520 [Ferruginibacter sp.]